MEMTSGIMMWLFDVALCFDVQLKTENSDTEHGFAKPNRKIKFCYLTFYTVHDKTTVLWLMCH